MLRNEGDRITRVVVCPPKIEYFEIGDPLKHNIREIANREKAMEQHAALCKLLRESGCEVLDMPEMKGHPNSVFTRDMAVCTPNGYVKLRPGIETREEEGEWIARFLDSTGEPCAGEILSPGTVDGGDVFLLGDVAFIGRSRRTNDEGIRQLGDILRAMDYEMRPVDLPNQYLHLDQTIGVLGPDRLICCEGMYDRGLFAGIDTVAMTCTKYNANIICLGESEIIAPSMNTGVIRAAEEHGVTVHRVDLLEFWKGTGGPNCLIMPVERK